MSNPLDQITKKEPRKYDSIFDFPRFVFNEILSDWKSYQTLKSHDMRRKSIIRYITAKWKVFNLEDKIHLSYENKDDLQIKVIKFMDKTFYLIKGARRSNSYKAKNKVHLSQPPIAYSYFEDGTRNECILFADPIIEFYTNPRTIVNKTLDGYDDEWYNTNEERCLYRWFFKIYSDLCELVTDCYETYPNFMIGDKNTISLGELLVESLMVQYWYTDNIEKDVAGIKRAKQNVYNANNNVMMILKSFHIYRHTVEGGTSFHYTGCYGLDSNFNIYMKNIIELSKLINSDLFRESDNIKRSALIKEKEYEINHE
jgi:hypothetical protein